MQPNNYFTINFFKAIDNFKNMTFLTLIETCVHDVLFPFQITKKHPVTPGTGCFFVICMINLVGDLLINVPFLPYDLFHLQSYLQALQQALLTLTLPLVFYALRSAG